YGMKTALYGTLLPSPMIALSFPEIIRQIQSEGHEIQFHAWDHRRWQDELQSRSLQWIKDWFEKGIQAFTKLSGNAPSAFGAPAWLIDDRVMDILKDYRFDYLSCTRAQKPFIHEDIGLVEIPSDLPCFEEVGVHDGISTIIYNLKDEEIHVLPVHAEAEGGIWSAHFIQLLEQIKMINYRVTTLSEIKGLIPSDKLTVRKYRMELLPGRSVPCAV
ncbi:MAG TPA: DUF2334 domain-containing protein, partial [Syntrophales bacterium]|nr:DUF2334 domain-containing protein [Syntrophales bacterium]